MKPQKLLTIIPALLCAFAGVKAGAAQTIQTITLSVTAITQAPTGTGTGTITNFAPAKSSTQMTPEFLSRLAQDEFAESNWPSNSFPKGAVLASVPKQEGSAFAVMLGTNVLVDVSDIVHFKNGVNDIFSGSENIQTGLATPSVKRIYLGTVTFDDSQVANPDGPLTFSLTGIITEIRTDTVPKNGVYSESFSAKMTMGSGEGNSNSGSFVCTGTVSAVGKAVLPAP